MGQLAASLIVGKHDKGTHENGGLPPSLWLTGNLRYILGCGSLTGMATNGQLMSHPLLMLMLMLHHCFCCYSALQGLRHRQDDAGQAGGALCRLRGVR